MDLRACSLGLDSDELVLTITDVEYFKSVTINFISVWMLFLKSPAYIDRKEQHSMC